MHTFLKLKHWQVFFILLPVLLLTNFTWVGHDFFNTMIHLAGTLLYFIWYFIIGITLTEHLPKRVEISNAAFIINTFGLILSIFTLIIFFDGEYSSGSLLGFVWICYFIYAFFQVLFFPAKVLRSIEMKKNASFSDYFGYMLLMVFWPIGIWWLQPKLNKIILASEREEAEFNKMITD